MSIEIKDAGPVESLTVPVEAEGGIIIIRGMNDAGKSETLRAIKKLLGGNDKIQKRYGTAKGLVEGLGVTVNLMANARASGECEAVSMEGKLDIGTLIDPGLKDPVAADKARIKALLTVRGVKADISFFGVLMSGLDWEESLKAVATDATLAATDLVDMAARLKKDFEGAARRAADKCKTLEVEARGKRDQAAGVDMEAESDRQILQDRLEEAISEEGRKKEQRKRAIVTRETVASARQDLRRAKDNYDGPTAAEAGEEVQDVAEVLALQQAEVVEARRKLQLAMEEESRLETALEIAKEKQLSAQRHEEALAGWAETIENTARVEEVTADEIAEAEASVVEAREAVERGVLIREAKRAAIEADELQKSADDLKAKAEQLRNAAKGTTDVLAGAVSSGALVPVTDDNGNFRFAVPSENDDERRVYYHDLGPGRRTTIAALEVASCLRDAETIGLGLVVLPQEQWEGLDWENRRRVADEVKRLGLTLITAEADKSETDSGGIRAERFEA